MSIINTKIFLNTKNGLIIHEVVFYKESFEICSLFSSEAQKDSSYIDIYLPKEIVPSRSRYRFINILTYGTDLTTNEIIFGTIKKIECFNYLDILLNINFNDYYNIKDEDFKEACAFIKQGIEEWIFNA